MKILHFTKKYGNTSETFVNQYVRKSETFGESIVVSFKNVTEEKIHLLPSRSHRRRTITGLIKYLVDILSSFTKWEARFLEILEQEKPDIIHCHFGTMGVLLNRLNEKGLLKIPTVVSFYGFDISSLPLENLKYKHQLLKLFNSKNVFFFGEGPSLCEKIISHGAAKNRILVNPLIVPTIGIPVRTIEETEVVKFLMIGRFVEKKGFHLALKALGQLKGSIENFEVTIIGFGAMEADYIKIVEQYKLNENVKFVGKKSHEEVREALATHDFFLHPSLTAKSGDSEGGAPTILIEAQVAEIPIISSRHADIPYVMGYHNFLVNENDLESLKNVIIHALNFKGLEELIEKGKKHVKNQHNINSKKYFQNIEFILSSH